MSAAEPLVTFVVVLVVSTSIFTFLSERLSSLSLTSSSASVLATISTVTVDDLSVDSGAEPLVTFVVVLVVSTSIFTFLSERLSSLSLTSSRASVFATISIVAVAVLSDMSRIEPSITFVVVLVVSTSIFTFLSERLSSLSLTSSRASVFATISIVAIAVLSDMSAAEPLVTFVVVLVVSTSIFTFLSERLSSLSLTSSRASVFATISIVAVAVLSDKTGTEPSVSIDTSIGFAPIF